MSCITIPIDEDTWTFFAEKLRTAKKIHKCTECNENIYPKQKYMYETGLYDGVFQTYKTCSACLELRNKYFHSWIFGCILDDLYYHLDDLSLTDMDNLSPEAQTKIDKILTWELV